jgi:hypothetical protein
MRLRELTRLGAPRVFAVRGQDGRYFAEHQRVGFIFVVDGRWMRTPKFCSKYPRTIAEQVARERGGEVVQVV